MHKVFSPQVTDAIKKSAKGLCLFHHPKDSCIAFNQESHFMPSGTGVAVFDRITGDRRQSCAKDVKDLIRLQDGLSNLDIARPMVTAVEFGENSDLVECYLALRYTGKPFLHRTLSEKNAEIVLEMLSIALGSQDQLQKRPPFAAVYCPKSPLSMTPEGARCMLRFASEGIPILVLSMAMAGATAPVTLPGIVTLINAEVLAGITIIQTLYPEASVLYGSVASVLDMKTAVLALAPERGLVNSLCADMAQRYGIPSVMGGLSTDAKQLDEQAGFEKAITVWPLVGKANLVFGMGVMDSANTYSFEQLVLDDEMIGSIKRACYGVEAVLREEEISMITKIGWAGEYLTAPHTLKNFRQNWYPQLMTRTSFEKWEKENKPLLIRIREAITKNLSSNAQCFTSPDVDQEIRKLLLKNGVDIPIDL